MGTETVLYSAQLQQVEEGRFALTQVAELSAAVESECVASYSLETGELGVPCVGNDITLLADEPNNPSFFYQVGLFNLSDPLNRQLKATAKPPTGFGSELGQFNGVTIYSNGNDTYVGTERSYSTINSIKKDVGVKWQCVEFVNRYYWQQYGIALRDKYSGNANRFWNNASTMGLDSFSNGGTAIIPQVGDILVSNGGANGHVAIVRSVSSNQVCVAHQNFANSTADENKCLTMTSANGRYTVAEFNGNLPIVGWLRRRLATPQITSPVNGATLSSMNANFQWKLVDTANNYRIIISQNSSFSGFKDAGGNSTCDATCFTTATSGTSYPNSMGKRGWTYYVKVRAANGVATSSWSSVVSFKTPK